MHLEQSAGTEATLADGRTVTLEAYHCYVEWMGERHGVEVIGNESVFPLLGVGLLLGCRLNMDDQQLSVSIT